MTIKCFNFDLFFPTIISSPIPPIVNIYKTIIEHIIVIIWTLGVGRSSNVVHKLDRPKISNLNRKWWINIWIWSEMDIYRSIQSNFDNFCILCLGGKSHELSEVILSSFTVEFSTKTLFRLDKATFKHPHLQCSCLFLFFNLSFWISNIIYISSYDQVFLHVCVCVCHSTEHLFTLAHKHNKPFTKIP